MWKLSKPRTLSRSISVKDTNGNLKRMRVVDPYGQQEFNINRFGWLTSDISLLFNAASQNIQDNLMARLQVIKSDSPNMSTRELIDTLVPRYCQSYAEREQFMSYLREQHPDFFTDPADPSELHDDESDDDKPSE